jgi:hypothetical protein
MQIANFETAETVVIIHKFFFLICFQITPINFIQVLLQYPIIGQIIAVIKV